jgi:hypothetical protein
MSVNYTRDGSVGFTANGWIIRRSEFSATPAWQVFNEDCVLVSTWDTRDEAEEATR